MNIRDLTFSPASSTILDSIPNFNNYLKELDVFIIKDIVSKKNIFNIRGDVEKYYVNYQDEILDSIKSDIKTNSIDFSNLNFANKTVYIVPKSNIARTEVSELKDKFKIKITRSLSNADYSILSHLDISNIKKLISKKYFFNDNLYFFRKDFLNKLNIRFGKASLINASNGITYVPVYANRRVIQNIIRYSLNKDIVTDLQYLNEYVILSGENNFVVKPNTQIFEYLNNISKPFIDIVSIDKNLSATKNVFTMENFDNIRDMFNSKSKNDIQLATDIVIFSNICKNYFYILFFIKNKLLYQNGTSYRNFINNYGKIFNDSSIKKEVLDGNLNRELFNILFEKEINDIKYNLRYKMYDYYNELQLKDITIDLKLSDDDTETCLLKISEKAESVVSRI